MNIAVVGTGYVGLVSGVCFSEIGHHATCIDIDQNKIHKLQQGLCPIYEPGLDDILQKNLALKRAVFSTDFFSLKNAEIIFLAVGTPSYDDGRADLRYLYAAAESVAKSMQEGAVIVIKSTVPIGTSHALKSFIKSKTDKTFYLINNPEFLREGQAVEDFMNPDRVIIGYEEQKSADLMAELYAPLIDKKESFYTMSNLSAEMTKYTANCFLAAKISFINEIANLCDLTGADIDEVRKGIAGDPRIGKHFLYPGLGFGGSCFPKDVSAFQLIAKDYKTELKIVKAVEEVNNVQKYKMLQKMKVHYKQNLKGKIFAFWGVAFKAGTDDVRESAAIYLAEALLRENSNVYFYDPVAGKNYLYTMKNRGNDLRKIISFENKYSCLKNADGLVIITDWREFFTPKFQTIKQHLKTPVIFDGKNLLPTQKVLSFGFDYYAIGKRITLK